MYKLLKINNFRQFTDKEIYLGKRLTVFAGRNSTGKSTLLGILANSAELKKGDGTTYSNRQFRAEFSEIFHGSKNFDKPGSNQIRIELADERGEMIDYRTFRTAWQNNNGKDRFRVIPSKILDDGRKTEAKMQIPVIYLGLSRLFPIGEANEDGIKKDKVKFFDTEQKEWFKEQYNRILSLYDNVTDISSYFIGETDKKGGIAIETDKYDYLTNSSGQDNLGQILMAILSFENLKKQRLEWKGGLLLIDEIDATLHPAAQKRLFDLLSKEAKKNNFQVIITTHSSDLLEHVCTKTNRNGAENNEIELYYFSNANKFLDIKRNPEFFTVENDLSVRSVVQSNRLVKVYSEDSENRWFIKNMIPEFLQYIDLLDVSIGCDQLISIYTADINYFGNVLIIFDGDVTDSQLNRIPKVVRERHDNIIKLPGICRPEEVLYKYLIHLDAEHPYWQNAESAGMNWTYFKENGPDSDQYNKGKERDKYKEWFNAHVPIFDSTKLYDYWAYDNKTLVDEFKELFVKKYNVVAQRNFYRTIPHK